MTDFIFEVFVSASMPFIFENETPVSPNGKGLFEMNPSFFETSGGPLKFHEAVFEKEPSGLKMETVMSAAMKETKGLGEMGTGRKTSAETNAAA